MSWIIQGFPRTRVQALSLQNMEIVPDKFINLTMQRDKVIEYLKQPVLKNPSLADDADEIAERRFIEYEINSNAVLETFNQYVY